MAGWSFPCLATRLLHSSVTLARATPGPNGDGCARCQNTPSKLPQPRISEERTLHAAERHKSSATSQ
eukprot:11209311-Lingulodinium_polyedra.AAC.1